MLLRMSFELQDLQYSKGGGGGSDDGLLLLWWVGGWVGSSDCESRCSRRVHGRNPESAHGVLPLAHGREDEVLQRRYESSIQVRRGPSRKSIRQAGVERSSHSAVSGEDGHQHLAQSP